MFIFNEFITHLFIHQENEKVLVLRLMGTDEEAPTVRKENVSSLFGGSSEEEEEGDDLF